MKNNITHDINKIEKMVKSKLLYYSMPEKKFPIICLYIQIYCAAINID
jgi:hypothetical protein